MRFWHSLVENWVGLNKKTDVAVKDSFK